MGKKYRSVWYRCLATLLMAVMLLGNLGLLPEAKAATNLSNSTTFSIIDGKTIKAADVEWQGKSGCWVYAQKIYGKIWNSTSTYSNKFSSSNNILKNLSNEERKVTAENTSYFIGKSKLGAVIRVCGCSSNCKQWSNDGLACGHKGHSMILVAKNSASLTVVHNTSSGVKTTKYTWKEFYNSYGAQGYTYFKYIKWPNASPISAYQKDYDVIDSKTRIGISTKPASGEDQCYVKEKPLEDSNNKSASVPKGQTVKIVGAVKNKYGNTWYKTADGSFVWEGDVTVWEYSTLFSVSANFYTVKNQNSHAAPYADSDKIDAYPTGTIFKVKSFVTNSYGNVWVELSDGSYMNFYDKNADVQNVNFVSHVSQPTISGETKPTGNINVTNQGFWLKGTVKAEVPFLTLSTRIIDRETGKDVEGRSPATIKPGNVKSVAISKDNDSKDLDSLTKFTNLPKGWYQYQLNAQFGFTYSGKTFQFGGTHNFITSDFTVGNPGTLDVTPTPTPIPMPTLSPTPTPSGNEENEEVSLILGDAWFNEEGFIEIEVFFSPLKDMLAYPKFTFERDFDAQFAYPRGEAAGVSWTCNANGLTFDNSLGISSSGYARLFNIVFEQTDKYLSDFTFTIHCVDAEMYDSETNTYTPIAVKSATKSYHLTPPEAPPAGDEGNRLAGDAKEDGVVDMRDALTVLKYLAGWDVQINLSNADVNRDTACDMRDALSILKYLAGWNVVLQ